MTVAPLRWYRTGELDEWEGEWHLVALGWTLDTYLQTMCGTWLDRGNHQWTNGTKAGWEWLRKHRAKICLECVDALGKG